MDIEETHCYLLCGTKRALLIDTGLGVANIKEVVDKLTLTEREYGSQMTFTKK